jgi:hypothetical protein
MDQTYCLLVLTHALLRIHQIGTGSVSRDEAIGDAPSFDPTYPRLKRPLPSNVPQILGEEKLVSTRPVFYQI